MKLFLDMQQLGYKLDRVAQRINEDIGILDSYFRETDRTIKGILEKRVEEMDDKDFFSRNLYNTGAFFTAYEIGVHIEPDATLKADKDADVIIARIYSIVESDWFERLIADQAEYRAGV